MLFYLFFIDSDWLYLSSRGVDMGLSVVEVCLLLLTKTDFRWWIISVLWLV